MQKKDLYILTEENIIFKEDANDISSEHEYLKWN